MLLVLHLREVPWQNLCLFRGSKSKFWWLQDSKKPTVDMNTSRSIKPEALEVPFDAKKDLFREPVNIRCFSGRRTEYTQQLFHETEGEFCVSSARW